jgi:hypothetical protein
MTVQIASIQTFTSPMAQTRLAANEVADKLAAAEAAIDAAIAAVAALTASMPIATAKAKIGTHVLHEAMMHASESCSQLVKSRTNIIRSHKALRVAQDDVGLGEVSFMDFNCPPDKASADGSAFTAIAA